MVMPRVAKGQPDLPEVMFVVRSDLVEFIPQRANAIDTMHPLQMATTLIVHARMIDDRVANRSVHLPGDIERHPSIVESLCPRILIHHPKERTRLAEHSLDAIERGGLTVGEVMQEIPHGPLAGGVGAREVARIEREAFQRLVSRPFQLGNE